MYQSWRRWETVCQIDVHSVLLHVVSEVWVCHFCWLLWSALVNSVALLSLNFQWKFMNYWLEWCGRKACFVVKMLRKATKKPQDSLARLQRAPPGYGTSLEGTQLGFIFLIPIRMLSAHLRLSWFFYPEEGGRSFVQNISVCQTRKTNPQNFSAVSCAETQEAHDNLQRVEWNVP